MIASERLTVALAQVNLLVGDVQGNLALTLREAARARDELHADLVLFPELTLSGYQPEDLLFHRGLRTQIERAVQQLAGGAPGIDLVLGFPEYQGNQIYNSAGVYRDGRRVALRRKSCLPNYRVFDEKRYFTAGEGAAVFECNGVPLGLLVFEGNSFVMDARGGIVTRAPAYAEGLYRAQFERRDSKIVPVAGAVAPELGTDESVYRALVLGVRDYVSKHGFAGVVMGLSGGVDSALTLAVAVDALGAQRVQAGMMPSRHTSQMSIEDATPPARPPGVPIRSIPIQRLFQAALPAPKTEFARRPAH